MAQRKWKGKLTKNIINLGDSLQGKKFTFKKGQEVIVWKKRVYTEDHYWDGEYEYYYSLENGTGLVRMKELHIEV